VPVSFPLCLLLSLLSIRVDHLKMSAIFDVALLMKAANFAAERHAAQRRKDVAMTLYVNHVIGVCHNLTQAGVTNVDVLCAALLHDTLEDTETTYDELVDEFGGFVASFVEEVSDDKSLPKAERKRLQVEHAAHASVGAQMIKLADKLNNLESLVAGPPAFWTIQRRRDYISWAKQVTDACRGACPPLEKRLDDFYQKTVFADDAAWDASALELLAKTKDD